MTAVVGILNRQAVAIAADSAVTINGKITNRALKIFTLSKYHPVGVMIYNNANFMNTPWETIIKMYRKQLGDKSFAKVVDYQEDFIRYLKTKSFFVDEAFQEVWLKNTYLGIVQQIYDNAQKMGGDINEDIIKSVDAWLSNINGYKNICPDFEGFTIEEFNSFPNNYIASLCTQVFTPNGITITAILIEKITEALFKLMRAKEEYFMYTGLVFVGFGEDEIYPSLIPINVTWPVGKRLRYYVEDEKKVSIGNPWNSYIAPFAQTETMTTILSGVSPKLEEIYVENFSLFFSKYNETILKLIGTSNPTLSSQIKNIDFEEVLTNYKKEILEAKNRTYISPLVDAVSTLSKEDLSEMAESLIYLTYLQKRITLAAEDVGGTVDVAVISKGDGFIWIKRKNYFNPELNRNFLSNYFR